MIRRLLPLLCCLLVACASPTPASRFYLLAGDALTPLANRPALSLGVGPVTLPAHLDRPQIVTRSGRNELIVDEYRRWAGPLDEELPRVLADDLGRLLGTDRIALHPWRDPVRVDYQVMIEFLRFDAEHDGTAVVDARWRLIADGELVETRRSRDRIAADSNDTAGIVAALSEGLGALAGEIAQAIERAEAPRAPGPR